VVKRTSDAVHGWGRCVENPHDHRQSFAFFNVKYFAEMLRKSVHLVEVTFAAEAEQIFFIGGVQK
jgi:hypothetical protein